MVMCFLLLQPSRWLISITFSPIFQILRKFQFALRRLRGSFWVLALPMRDDITMVVSDLLSPCPEWAVLCKFPWCDGYQVLHMIQELCCRYMCNYLWQWDDQEVNYWKKTIECKLLCKNVIAVGPNSCLSSPWSSDKLCLSVERNDIRC